MNCKEARKTLLNPGHGKTAIVEQAQAREHVAACPVCQAGLNRLAVEIKQEEQICAEVQEILPLYIEDELDGKPVKENYSLLRQHLAHCSLCIQAHAELRELLQAEREEQKTAPSAYPAFSLPFLHSPSPTGRAIQWAIETATDTLGRISATVTISKAYIATAISPQALSPVFRSSKSLSAETKHFPLTDIPLEELSWIVSLEAVREEVAPPHPERWHLQVSVASLTPSGHIQVRISDGREERTTRLNENGIAVFSDVPVSWLMEPETTPSDQLQVEIQQVGE